VVHCEKFTKGGGWRGFGVGGLAFAAVANVVSHARAAARRKGKVLIAQVRYEWLVQAGAPADKRGRRRTLRLVVDAGSASERRLLALDIGLPERVGPADYAALVVQHAAAAQLVSGALAAADAEVCRRLTAGPLAGGEPHWDLPGAVTVGTAPTTLALAPTPGRTVVPSPAREPVPEVEPDPVAAANAEPAAPEPRSHDNPGECPACGHAVPAGVAACGWCGKPQRAAGSAPAPMVPVVPAPTSATVPEATTNRALLRATGPVDEPPPQPPVPPPYLPTPGPAGPYGSSIAPEVLLVAVGLFGLGALVLYPVLRYGFPVLGHLTDPNDFARAFAALVAYIMVMLAGAGVALLLLAVGLLRGSRVSQLLTCLLCAVLVVAELANEPNNLNVGQSSGGQHYAVLAGSVAVALLLLLPGARRHFARDSQRPIAVDLAAAVGLYFGVCAVIGGLMLMMVGVLGAKFVWWGIGLSAAGAGLALANRPLRAGRNGARIAASICYIGYVVLGFVIADKNGDASSPSAVIPLGIALVALGALWLAPSSQQHFATPRPMIPLHPAALAAWAAVAIASVVFAGVGFHAASTRGSLFAGDAPTDQSLSQDPGYSTPAPSYSAAPPSGVSSEQAQSAAAAAFQAMAGNGSADTCNGDLPSMAISDFSIDEVTPQTSGSFFVSAGVTLDDGTIETVTVLIGTDANDAPCVEADTVQTSNVQAPTPTVTAPVEPSDVPDVPRSGDPVPTDAALPSPPQDPNVLAYDSGQTPTDASAIIEYQPDGLSSAEEAAVADVISFMAHINQQDFPSAWNDSTDSLNAPDPTSSFRRGFRTSRFYQVAFGQPRVLAGDLIVVPARFVSRQDAAAQGNPSGVTDCTYWPQYVFVVAKVNGQWLDDVAGKYVGRSQLSRLKRIGQDGGRYLNPVSQRVTC
jgi:hypothetical protein